MNDNLYIVSTINIYGLEVTRCYEGYDHAEAIRQYQAKVDEGCAARVLECIPKGFRVLRLKHENQSHPAQATMNEFLDAIPNMKGGGL
jgi:hypothetical protein